MVADLASEMPSSTSTNRSPDIVRSAPATPTPPPPLAPPPPHPQLSDRPLPCSLYGTSAALADVDRSFYWHAAGGEMLGADERVFRRQMGLNGAATLNLRGTVVGTYFITTCDVVLASFKT
ncbi:hypothetical protein CPLU01_06778 [Colletotrichum plurivorum]|uniref:Uncharacterized protein n=1 Tax=Colletotrichum plurivorum TaxID=2175906 RepID=A0A8H6KH24_9PEZI|nr:hypothetical protein CPLU01_06778 [Colletotrichum plurivorum]